MPDQVLSDVKVVDLSWYIAGSYCTKLLADYGADVIKIEKPDGGDPARSMGPFLNDEPHPERSGLFLYLNTNKRGITLNLKSVAGKNIFRQLVKDADILVESFSPGVMQRLGFSYEELAKENPRLVMTSISNFGQTGPYRDFKSSDTITFAMGGAMFTTGTPDRPPVAVARNVKMYEGGILAAVATLGAFTGAKRHGVGDYIDIGLMEAQLGSSDRRDAQLLTYSYTGFSTPRRDPTRTRASCLPSGLYPAKDGWVRATINQLNFPIFAAEIGMPDLPKDPRFQNIADLTYAHVMDGFFIEWLSTRGKDEVCTQLQEAGIYCTMFNTPAEAVNDAHFRARGFWIEIDHPATGKLTYPGASIDMGEGGFQVRRPAPLLGQHNVEVYCDQLGYSREDLVRLRELGVI